MMPFKHDWDKITLGLYLVWFVRFKNCGIGFFLLYKIEASFKVVFFLRFINRIILLL